MSEKNNNLLSHPEVKQILKKDLASIISESDRGAILISAEIINSHLEKLFEEKTFASNKLLKKILSYLGLF